MAKITGLEVENADVKAKYDKAMNEVMKLRAELKSRIEKLEKGRTDTVAENARRDNAIAELKAEVVKLRDNNEEGKQKTQDISSGEIVNKPSSVVAQLDNVSELRNDQSHVISENSESLEEIVTNLSRSICISPKIEVNTLAKSLTSGPNVSEAQVRRQDLDSAKKTLEQYPTLYYEYSSENFDYYRITNETLCSLYKLNHEDEEGIEGKYKNETYYIKCEAFEISTII
ncbi:1863_t:CDS:2 [Ambispora gerdemannii]|uniref:1863_t:CDS:1 n=1 Tax=Ambispora gerdemannii TaxID=144530 RepID=A0A9N8ZWV0_9GLOM|nr:1863_t:CDS:2 [Ambispora gerdemannii]